MISILQIKNSTTKGRVRIFQAILGIRCSDCNTALTMQSQFCMIKIVFKTTPLIGMRFQHLVLFVGTTDHIGLNLPDFSFPF